MNKACFAVVCALSALCAAADEFTLDFARDATLRAANSPTIREAVCDFGEFPVPAALSVGDSVTLRFFDDTARTLTIRDEMPGFGGMKAYGGDIGDGIAGAVAVIGEGSATFEVRDFSSGRLYRAAIREGAAHVEEIDLLKIKHGGCIEIETPEPAKDGTDQGATPPGKKLVGAVPGNPFDDNIVAPAPVMVDIMLVFDTGAQAWIEKSAKYSSITNFAITQVAKMNQVLCNTDLHTNFWFRLVDVATVDARWTTIDDTILPSIEEDMRLRKGVWADVRERRDKCGADLLSLIIDTGSASGTTGIGYIMHGTTYEEWTSAYTKRWSYSCCAIRSVDLEYTLSHETGHNMGLAHSTTLPTWRGIATFDYSNGYNFTGAEDGRHYNTVMAYNYDAYYSDYVEIPYFSSPDYSFKGTPIGTVESNDCTRALRQTCVGIQDRVAQAIPLPSDVVFSPAAQTAYHISLSTPGGHEIHYTTDGSTPTRESALYTEPLTLTSGEMTVKAVAAVDGATLGAVATKTYYAALDMPQFVRLSTPSERWTGGNWRDQDGAVFDQSLWYTTKDKTAILDQNADIEVNTAISLGTLVLANREPFKVIASGRELFATNIDVVGAATLYGTDFRFDSWNLHPESTLVLSPGQGRTYAFTKNVAFNSPSATVVISNGTVSATVAGSNAGCFGQALLRIAKDGILSIDGNGWKTGWETVTPLNIDAGGKLRVNSTEVLGRALVLDGGSVDVAVSGRALEFRGTSSISATEDSAISDVTANGAALAYFCGRDMPIDVAGGKRLDFDIAVVPHYDRNFSTGVEGIVKTGAGELRFAREQTCGGATAIRAGTLAVGYNSSAATGQGWTVAGGATLKIENGASLSIPSLALAHGASLVLPAAASAPLSVSGALDLTHVSLALTGATDLSHGKSYPLIAASGGFRGISRAKKTAFPALPEGFVWLVAENGGVLSATVATQAEAMPPVPLVSNDESIVLDIPSDATRLADGGVTLSATPILIGDLDTAAIAVTLDVEIPEGAQSGRKTICSWKVGAFVIYCVREEDGTLDCYWVGEQNHVANAKEPVVLSSGRHTICIGYYSSAYDGTWVYVDGKAAFYASGLKFSTYNVSDVAIGGIVGSESESAYGGLAVRQVAFVDAASGDPLAMMTASGGEVSYNYVAARAARAFATLPAGGFTTDEGLIEAGFSETPYAASVSCVASFPRDATGTIMGFWVMLDDSHAVSCQAEYEGDGTFVFRYNGYSLSTLPSKAVANASPDVELPHLYTVTFLSGYGFTLYQDGVEIAVAEEPYNYSRYVGNKLMAPVDFGCGSWHAWRNSQYVDYPLPMPGFKVYSSHIALGTDSVAASAEPAMESLGFDPAYDALSIARKLAFLPEYQTATGVAAPPEEAAERKPTVDILVAFDQGAKAYAENAGKSLEQLAGEQVARMNGVLANNKLTDAFDFRLAGVCTIDAKYTVGSTLLATINEGGGMGGEAARTRAVVRAARERFGADTVTLLYSKGNVGGVIGDSFWLSDPGDIPSCDEEGYNACNLDSVVAGYTMLHETAHNMGCGHSDNQADQPWESGYYDYSRGWHFTDSKGVRRHTIMAYDQDANRQWYHAVPYFSTSDASVTYVPEEGAAPVALGDASHDNARVLRNTCGGVAQWRERVASCDGDVIATDADGEEISSGRVFKNSISVSLAKPGDGDSAVVYTLDGTAPTRNSSVYETPLEITGDAVLNVAVLDGLQVSPARTIRLYRLDAIPSEGVWSTSAKHPWTTDGTALRSRNYTNYGKYCTSPLFVKVAGPKRLVFSHKSYFMSESLETSKFSHFDVMLDDAVVLEKTDCNTAWTVGEQIEIPDGEHVVTFAYSQRNAMNNPSDYKDGTPEIDDAVWLADIRIEDPPENETFEVPAGVTVALADIPAETKYVIGEGTVDCGDSLPGDLGWTGARWRGTLAFSGFGGGDHLKDFRFELYGNANSKIKLTNCYIPYLSSNNATFPGTILLAADGAGNPAFSTGDGYSSCFNVFGALEGDGAMLFSNNPAQAYVFNVATNYTGSITINASASDKGRRVVFGYATSSEGVPAQQGIVTVKPAATASIGANATWFAYNGVNITGTLLVKGANATLDCDAKNSAVGLRLADNATLRFDSPTARLAFARPPQFSSGTVKIAFADGVAPVDGALLIDWSSSGAEPMGAFAFADSSLAGRWTLEKSSSGLTIHAKKPDNRIDIENGAYIPWDSALQEWMDIRGLSDNQEFDPDLTWQEFLAGKAVNGYARWECYVLGLDRTWRADDTLKADIQVRNGKVVVTTAENARSVEGVVLYTTLYGSDKLVNPLPEIKKVKGTEIEMDAGSSGFYKVKVSFEAQ